MALTDKKRKFAAALLSGASNRDAAIHAGYSEKTAPQAGSRLAKDPDVLAEIGRKNFVNTAKERAESAGKPLDLPDLSQQFSDPKDFLSALMNDIDEEMRLRVDAAKTLMPFVHQKKGEGGKKDATDEAAKKASSGRFGASAPPKLAASNGKRV